MERPLLKAAGVAAGTLFVAIGISAQLGGANLFAARAQGHHTVSQAQPSASPSPEASPSPQPPPQEDAIAAAGAIYSGSEGGGKKKHGKGG
jgi:hypothetical protein